MKHRAPAQPRWKRAATTPNAARPKRIAAAIRNTSCTGFMASWYPGGKIVTRNLVNLAIWFALFTSLGFAWTGSLAAGAFAGGVGALVVTALSFRITVTGGSE